jgi:hypothetical protein
MSKIAQKGTTASTLAGIASGISTPALTNDERKLLRARNSRTPDKLIEMVAHLAQQGGGSVLGIPFDSTTASATLANASQAKTTIAVGRQTLQRMEDDMLQQRLTVADPAFAIYSALRRLVQTKAGNALLPAYNQMKALVRRKPSKATDETTSPAPTAAPAASAVTSATPAAAPTPVTPASAQATAPKAAAATSN